jgi:hypothetical protein
MPTELVERITASLKQEQQRRHHPAPPPLSGWRRRRRWSSPRLIVAAVGVAAATTVGVFGLQSLLRGGASTATSVGASAELATKAGVPGSGGAASPSPGQAAAPETSQPTAASGAAIHIELASQRHTKDTLMGAARQLVAHPGPGLPPLAAEAVGIGPMGTPIGARACLASLGVPAGVPASISFATYDGAAAAIVVTGEAGRWEVRVVSRHCGGAPAAEVLLAGPMPMR